MKAAELALLLLGGVSSASAWNSTQTYSRPQGLWSHGIKTILCGPEGPVSQLPLLIFVHGFGLYAEDYGYMCHQMPSKGYVVALVDSYAGYVPYEAGLEYDMEFLAGTLHGQASTNSSSPLFGRLSGVTVYSGHSLGATTSFMAATDPKGPSGKGTAQAIATLAPTKQGILADAALVKVPSLQLVGSKDCAASNGLAASGLPIYQAMTATECKVLVVLVDGNHCNFTSPVKGSCPYDKCGSLTKEAQQTVAVSLFDQFFQMVFGGASFDDFAGMLGKGADEGRFMFKHHCNGSESTSSNFVNQSCPC